MYRPYRLICVTRGTCAKFRTGFRKTELSSFVPKDDQTHQADDIEQIGIVCQFNQNCGIS